MEYSVLVQPFPAHSYWFSNLLRGMQEAAARRQGSVRVLGEQDAILPDTPVLLVGSDKSWIARTVAHVFACGATPCPVGACLPNSEQIGGISFDLEDAVLRCLSYLHHCGRRRVFLLGLSPASLADQLKHRVFSDAVRRGLIEGEAIVCQNSIEECVKEFATRPLTSQDAVLCANDTVALCLLAQERIAAMRLPEELFVVGMGNTYLSQYGALPLTSVEFDYRELGRQAIRTVHFFAKTPSACRMRLSVPCRILVRESTQCLPLPEENLSFLAPQLDLCVQGRYFSGERAEKIIALESVLQSEDETAKTIVRLLSRGATYAQIAEAVELTDRAVQYRIKTLQKKCGVENGAQLRALLTRILQYKSDESGEKQ